MWCYVRVHNRMYQGKGVLMLPAWSVACCVYTRCSVHIHCIYIHFWFVYMGCVHVHCVLEVSQWRASNSYCMCSQIILSLLSYSKLIVCNLTYATACRCVAVLHACTCICTVQHGIQRMFCVNTCSGLILQSNGDGWTYKLNRALAARARPSLVGL